MAEEVLTLTVPADPKFAHSLRLLTLGLAETANLSFDETQDAKMIVDEAFIYALSTDQETIVVNFTLEEGILQMTFSLGKPKKEQSKETIFFADQDLNNVELARLVLDTLTDSFSVNATNNLLTVVKTAKD